jgi:hypothetical protein
VTDDIKLRLAMATMEIRNNHITAPPPPDEEKLQQAGLSRGAYFRAWFSQLDARDTEILTKRGFKHFGEYWRVNLSPETMEKSAFIRLLEGPLLDPGRLADPERRRIDRSLDVALTQAMISGELRFLREVAGEETVFPARLRPREAADWLLKIYPDLVPPTLRAFLEKDVALASTAVQPLEKHPGGRPPIWSWPELVEWFQKEFPDGIPPMKRPALLEKVNKIRKAQNLPALTMYALAMAIKQNRKLVLN